MSKKIGQLKVEVKIEQKIGHFIVEVKNGQKSDYAQAYVIQYTLILTYRTQNWIFVHNGIPYPLLTMIERIVLKCSLFLLR